MNIYLTDGTEEGFFTAAFFACTDANCIVTSARTVQLSLDANILEVASDAEKSARVRRKLTSLDNGAVRDIRLLLRRGSKQKEMVALRYLRLIVQKGGAVRGMLALPEVHEAREEMRKVTLEAHRFKGFIRFMEGENGIWYAPFAPDNDILELILPHFLARFGTQSFILHDTVRRRAALCRGGACTIAQTEESVTVPLSPDEQFFRSLWQEYYRSVDISMRPHARQMKNYMPVRYWKFLPEKNI